MTNKPIITAIREALDSMPSHNVQYIQNGVSTIIEYVDRAELRRILTAISTATSANEINRGAYVEEVESHSGPLDPNEVAAARELIRNEAACWQHKQCNVRETHIDHCYRINGVLLMCPGISPE